MGYRHRLISKIRETERELDEWAIDLSGFDYADLIDYYDFLLESYKPSNRRAETPDF